MGEKSDPTCMLDWSASSAKLAKRAKISCEKSSLRRRLIPPFPREKVPSGLRLTHPKPSPNR